MGPGGGGGEGEGGKIEISRDNAEQAGESGATAAGGFTGRDIAVREVMPHRDPGRSARFICASERRWKTKEGTMQRAEWSGGRQTMPRVVLATIVPVNGIAARGNWVKRTRRWRFRASVRASVRADGAKASPNDRDNDWRRKRGGVARGWHLAIASPQISSPKGSQLPPEEEEEEVEAGGEGDEPRRRKRGSNERSMPSLPSSGARV